MFLILAAGWYCTYIRDVQSTFFILVWFWFGFLKNSHLVWNEFGSFQFKKTWFGSDMIVIYYSCHSSVVNLQQILQRQWMK